MKKIYLLSLFIALSILLFACTDEVSGNGDGDSGGSGDGSSGGDIEVAYIKDIVVTQDGSELSFEASANGEGLTYHWYFDAEEDGDNYSETVTTTKNSVAKSFSPGEHWVVLFVKDENGNWANDSYTSEKTTILSTSTGGGGDNPVTGGDIDLDGDGSSNYDEHRNITASLFWVGEPGNEENGFIQNIESAWRGDWMDEYGLEDGPYINRYSDGFPISDKYKEEENPYYFALPYNDLTDLVSDGDYDEERDPSLTYGEDPDAAKKNREEVLPWADDSSDVDIWDSKIKNRWIKITANGKTCYAQWEDSGPFYYNDIDYVFGDDEPLNGKKLGAGIDLSPAVMLKLFGDASVGEETVTWQFIKQEDVPDGDWGKVVTTSQVGGW